MPFKNAALKSKRLNTGQKPLNRPSASIGLFSVDFGGRDNLRGENKKGPEKSGPFKNCFVWGWENQPRR
jgi:hypothetical protein